MVLYRPSTVINKDLQIPFSVETVQNFRKNIQKLDNFRRFGYLRYLSLFWSLRKKSKISTNTHRTKISSWYWNNFYNFGSHNDGKTRLG